MTIAVPCAKCSNPFEAGHGTLCPRCRPEGLHAGELRFPDMRNATVTPMNEAARKQMRANGEPFDEEASKRIERMLGL